MSGDTAAQWMEPGDETQIVDRVVQEFTAQFGYAPAGVWSAPGRVNLIGEHIDYNGGACMPFAIPERTWVAAAARPDGMLRGVSLQESHGDVELPLAEVQPGLTARLPESQTWFGYVAGVPWALADTGEGITGADFAIDSTVPIGAGLSSSAALSCAVALASDALADARWERLGDSAEGRIRLAEACVRSENEIVGASTGGLDQAASLRSQEGAVLVCDFRSGESFTVDMGLEAAGYGILVIDTQTTHQLLDGQYASRRQACETAAERLGVQVLRDALPECVTSADVDEAMGDWYRRSGESADSETSRRLHHVFSEMERVQAVIDLFEGTLDADRWQRLGTILDASHASLRDDYEVSCPELDTAVDAARSAGALGARMVGGGFGGSAIALLPEPLMATAATRIAEAFAEAGFAEPRFLRAVPSQPGRRDR